MTKLEQLFEQEFASEDARLALELAREDQHLLARLVEVRKARGLSQEEIADRLGLSQATISVFERVGNDPHLSTVRRYARALGVMVRHHVDEEAEDLTSSAFLSHVDGQGINSSPTATAVARALEADWAWPEEAEQIDYAFEAIG
jgi:transcriptional regulator with XRE-family HTH domain